MNGVTKTRPVCQTPGAFSLFFAYRLVMHVYELAALLGNTRPNSKCCTVLCDQIVFACQDLHPSPLTPISPNRQPDLLWHRLPVHELSEVLILFSFRVTEVSA
jgi:hypothetical protein